MGQYNTIDNGTLKKLNKKQKNSGSPYATSHWETPDATIDAYVLLPLYHNKVFWQLAIALSNI